MIPEGTAPAAGEDPAAGPSDYVGALVASFLGWTLDAFDFFVVVFALPAIAKDFGIDIKAIALTITVTLAFRPVGAFIFGLMADRYGRRLPADDRPRLLLGRRGAVRLRAELHDLPGSARALRHRHGGRVGRRRVARHGEGPPRWRGMLSGFLQEGYAVGYLLAAVLLLLRLPALGLAADVLHRRAARAAGALRPLPRARSRRSGRRRATRAGRARPRDRLAVAALPVSHRADDDDELPVARHAGHVPDVPASCSAASSRSRWRRSSWSTTSGRSSAGICFGLPLGPLRPARAMVLAARARDARDPAVGLRADHAAARRSARSSCSSWCRARGA